MKVLVGRCIKDACKSLRETLTSRADGDRFKMLKRTLRAVLIEKRVTPVRWLSEDLESLGHQLVNSLDERSRVERDGIWLWQIYDRVRHTIHSEDPALELPDNYWRIEQQLNR